MVATHFTPKKKGECPQLQWPNEKVRGQNKIDGDILSTDFCRRPPRPSLMTSWPFPGSLSTAPNKGSKGLASTAVVRTEFNLRTALHDIRWAATVDSQLTGRGVRCDGVRGDP